MTDSSEKITIRRWIVLFMLCLMYLITYLDRVNITAAAPVIMKDLGIDKATMGLIFSAFILAYGLAGIPGGWLGDRFGPRRVLTIIVTFWSAMTSATAMCTSLVSLWIVRFSFGLGEGGAFPTATRAMQLWLTKEERGFAQGIVHSCSRVAASVGPIICVSIMMLWGWRSVFYIFGAIGIVWAIVWWWIYRDRPEDDPKTSLAELAHIRGRNEDGSIK